MVCVVRRHAMKIKTLNTPLASMVHHLLLRPLVQRLTPLWLALAFAYAILARAFPAEPMRRSLAEGPWWWPAATWTAVGFAWMLAVRPHLRDVTRSPSLGSLWRLPIGHWRWSLMLAAPTLTALTVPALVILLLGAPGSGQASLVWVGAGAVALIAAALGLWWQAAIGLGCLFAGLSVTSATGAASWLVGVAVAIAGLGSCGPIYTRWRTPTRIHHGSTARWLRPRGPVTAIVRRDMGWVWQSNKRLLGAAMGLCCVGAFFIARALEQGRAAHQGLWALVALTAPLGGVLLTRLIDTLQHNLYPGQWPLGPAQRALGLWLVASVPALMAWAAGWAAQGAALHPGNALGLVMALAAGAVHAWWPMRDRWRPEPSIRLRFKQRPHQSSTGLGRGLFLALTLAVLPFHGVWAALLGALAIGGTCGTLLCRHCAAHRTEKR